MSIKQTIFISHANPEDNEFTRWLGAELTLAGYAVWYDLDRLRGGDVFWDKVENVIREEAIRFIAVILPVRPITKMVFGKNGTSRPSSKSTARALLFQFESTISNSMT